jgi:hypothetical protein
MEQSTVDMQLSHPDHPVHLGTPAAWHLRLARHHVNRVFGIMA